MESWLFASIMDNHLRHAVKRRAFTSQRKGETIVDEFRYSLIIPKVVYSECRLFWRLVILEVCLCCSFIFWRFVNLKMKKGSLLSNPIRCCLQSEGWRLWTSILFCLGCRTACSHTPSCPPLYVVTQTLCWRSSTSSSLYNPSVHFLGCFDVF